MNSSRHDTFRPIGQILAAEVLPALFRVQKLPLRISCLGVASNRSGADTSNFDRMIPLGECLSPEDAMRFAALRLAQGDICAGPESFPHFHPRIMRVQDRAHGLVLAGEIRAGIILWQPPVGSDAEARRVVIEASRLRGMAFEAADPAEARNQRDRAAVLEARLVDPFWRKTAADLLRLPHAA